jgi:hypothetical protein
MKRISFKTGSIIGSILLLSACLVSGIWAFQSRNEIKQLKVSLQSKENALVQSEEKIINIQNQNLEIAELFEFLSETQTTMNLGKKMVSDINSQKVGEIDFNKYTYPTEKRIELVDAFVNYQKKYTKDRLEKIYIQIGQKEEEVSKHQKMIEDYLNFAVNFRDRKNEPLGILRLNDLLAALQVEKAISATQEKIHGLLQNK